jgi:hypothetical protein
MPTKRASHLAVAAAVVALASAACSDWTPIRNAHDYAGQAVRVETAGKDIHIDEVVTCDDTGFVIASDESDCTGDRPRYDTRRDKVLIHDKDTRGTVGMVVAGVLGAVLIPTAIVGGKILTGH